MSGKGTFILPVTQARSCGVIIDSSCSHPTFSHQQILLPLPEKQIQNLPLLTPSLPPLCLSLRPVLPELWHQLPKLVSLSILAAPRRLLMLEPGQATSQHITPLPKPSRGSRLTPSGIQSSFHPPSGHYELDLPLLLWHQFLSVSSSFSLFQPHWSPAYSTHVPACSHLRTSSLLLPSSWILLHYGTLTAGSSLFSGLLGKESPDDSIENGTQHHSFLPSACFFLHSASHSLTEYAFMGLLTVCFFLWNLSSLTEVCFVHCFNPSIQNNIGTQQLLKKYFWKEEVGK